MAEHPEDSRRASVTMYDPARDIYTVSDAQDVDRSAERDARHQAEKRDTAGHRYVGASVDQPDAGANPVNSSVGKTSPE
jgi:hypothetical protein